MRFSTATAFAAACIIGTSALPTAKRATAPTDADILQYALTVSTPLLQH
jgi:hypothetical protein